LRGKGLTIRFLSEVHVNISGALFRTINDILLAIKSKDGNKEVVHKNNFKQKVCNND
jgi:hypothetical protein